MFIIICILSLILPELSDAAVTLIDLKCTPNPLYCTDTFCHLNRTVDADNSKMAHIRFGCTLIKEVPQLSGKIRLFVKSNNKYTSVGNNMNVEMDFCKISTLLSNRLLTTFLPNMTSMASNFHECPYSDKFLVESLIDGENVRAVPRWKRTMAEVSFFRGRYVPLLTVEFYANTQ